MRYWIGVASRDHVQKGVEGGFCQLCHGKASPLKRMRPGDWIIYYSSKEEYGERQLCQRFTAIGEVQPVDPYLHDMGNGFTPYRRDINFKHCEELDVLGMVPELSFIKDKRHWGAPFRFGFLEIPQEDFEKIAKRMLTEQLCLSIGIK